MNSLKIKFGLFSLLAILAASVFLTSCEQEGIVSSIQEELATNENHKIMDALCNDVHGCNDIEISEDAIIIDKCSHMDKDNFLEYLTALENGVEEEPAISKVPHPLDADKMIEMPIKDVRYYNEQNSPIVDERQRIISILRFAKNSKVSNIKYYILSSAIDTDCAGGYENSINNAASYWNGLSGCKVSFSRTYNYDIADIIIGCDTDLFFAYLSSTHYNLPSTTNARATWPNASTRAIGKYISINDTGNTANKKGRMIHEFGHCLGLSHTNGSGYLLYDSPASDANSIMNSTINRNSMVLNDKKAVRRLWPSSLAKPTNVSFQKVGGSVRIKLKNPGIAARPYNHLNVGHWYNGSYQPWGNWGHQADASGNYDIWWIQYFAPGRHYFYVQGGSHNNEVLSTYSGWYYVDM